MFLSHNTFIPLFYLTDLCDVITPCVDRVSVSCLCVVGSFACFCVFSEDTTDLVFEEFKRSYLKGIIGEDDDSSAEP